MSSLLSFACLAFYEQTTEVANPSTLSNPFATPRALPLPPCLSINIGGLREVAYWRLSGEYTHGFVRWTMRVG